jgi:hypothetical protein
MTDTGGMPNTDPALTKDPDSAPAHASDHGHGSAGEQLGPVDVMTWAYALGGGVIGIVVALAMLAARGG